MTLKKYISLSQDLGVYKTQDGKINMIEKARKKNSKDKHPRKKKEFKYDGKYGKGNPYADKQCKDGKELK